MPKPSKESLDTRVMRAMREAGERLPEGSDAEQILSEQTHSARATLSGVITSMATSLTEACVRLRHRGSVPPRHGRPGRPCSRCSVKVRHYNEAATLIAPDRTS